MQSFQQIITTQSDMIDMVLISDLHLSPHQPALMQAFLRLLDDLLALPCLRTMYILGDWFDAWLGDDIAKTPEMQHWLKPMISRLQCLNNQGCHIFVIQGNRDFLIGQAFCDSFFAKLQPQDSQLIYHGKKYLLMHGDQLCSDDTRYQYFRKIIQNPITKKLLLSLSLQKRQHIAQRLREKSQADNAKKSISIMDINSCTVAKSIKNFDILIHGHTHRPAIHHLDKGKKRLVLGDWRVIADLPEGSSRVEAVIAVATKHATVLTLFHHMVFDELSA